MAGAPIVASPWSRSLDREQERAIKRDAVLRAAAQLFNEFGYHATSGMAAIPARVTAAARARSNAADYARAFSMATAAMGLGQLAGPVLVGALADRFGSVAAPLFGAAAYGLGTVLASIDRRAVR